MTRMVSILWRTSSFLAHIGHLHPGREEAAA